MRLNCFSFGLTVFLLAHHAHTKKIFLPMHISHFEAVAGLQRRELEHFSDFYPQPQVQLTYGRHDGEEKLDFVNMTLHAGDGLPIVLLERLDHLIEYVDCNRKSGQMALAFKSRGAFERAINAWGFVNNDEEELRFLLITNHDGCSPANSRQPHIVTDLRQDSDFLTTHLTYHEVDLSHVSNSYEMSFGTYERQPRPSTEIRNKPRELLEDPVIGPTLSHDPVGTNEIDIGDSSKTDDSKADDGSKDGDWSADWSKGLEDLRKTIASYWDKISQTPDALNSKSETSPLLGGGLINGLGKYKLPEIHKPHLPDFHTTTDADGTWELSNKGSPYIVSGQTKLNEKKKILRNGAGNIQIFCTNCYFSVSLLITIRIKTKEGNWADIVAGTVTVNFSNLKAQGHVSFQRDGDNHADSISDQLLEDVNMSEDADIVKSPVGEFGGEIPNVGNFGLNWAYKFGTSVGVSGSGEVGVGWNIKLQGDALLTLDLVSNDHRVVGADLLEYGEPDIQVRKLTATAEIGVHGQLELTFGFDIFRYKLEVRVFMPLPEYQIAFKAAKSAGGICKEKGIDTGFITERKWIVQLKMGGLWSAGGADHPVGDEPLSKNFVGAPSSVECTACDIGVLTDEGKKPPPGITVPGKPPKPKTSELQTGDQVGLLDEAPNDTGTPNGLIASLQSPTQPDSSTSNDASGSSPENNADITAWTTPPSFPQSDDQTDSTKGYTASLPPGLVAGQPSSGDSSASPQPDPVADQSPSGDKTPSLPIAGQPSPGDNVASLPLTGQPSSGDNTLSLPSIGQPSAGDSTPSLPLTGQSSPDVNIASLPLTGQSSPAANIASLPPLPLSDLSSSRNGKDSLPSLGNLASTDNTGGSSQQPVDALASLPPDLSFPA